MSGFIPGSRGSLILDLLVTAMAVILPLLGFSVFISRSRKNYRIHRVIQSVLGLILGLAVIAFEVDMRVNGWRQLAEPSPYYHSWVFPSLILHLCFSIPTLLIWTYTIVQAFRQSIEHTYNKARIQHRKLGWISTYAMVGTTLTGWLFYYLSFLA